MIWIDRVLKLIVGGGLWTFVALHLAGAPDARAQIAQQLAEVLASVESNCSVGGDVYVYSEHHGEIDGGYLDCTPAVDDEKTAPVPARTIDPKLETALKKLQAARAEAPLSPQMEDIYQRALSEGLIRETIPPATPRPGENSPVE